jgi:uncharacterized membrane protein
VTEPTPPGSEEPEALRDDQLASLALLLRTGIVVSSIFLLVGIGLALQQAAPFDPSVNLPLANEAWFRWPTLAGRFGAGDGVAVITVGLLALVATPSARVLLGAYFFARNRDRALTAITATVLLLLLLGAFLVGPLLH